MKLVKRVITLGLISLILNTIWEFSQSFLYFHLSETPKYVHLISSSFTDMFIILSIFMIVSLKNKNFKWIEKPKKSEYLIVIFSGIIIAASIELIYLKLGKWQYTSIMPTIFGIGVSPLIQLALTGIISLIIMNKLSNN